MLKERSERIRGVITGPGLATEERPELGILLGDELVLLKERGDLTDPEIPDGGGEEGVVDVGKAL